jgi:hypothetical protein
MLNHIVLIQLKANAAPNAVKALVDGLRNMPATISEIVSLSCGEDINGGIRGGYNIGLYVQLKNRDQLPVYLNHATHKDLVKNLLEPVLEDLVVVDYET